MKVVLIKDSPAGKADTLLSGPEVWRLCFPVKGCVAAPADEEALHAVERDIATVRGEAERRLRDTMTSAGTLTLVRESRGERAAPARTTRTAPAEEVRPEPRAEGKPEPRAEGKTKAERT